MLSESQTIEEQSEKEIPNENRYKKPSELHRTFGMISTTITQPMREGMELFNIHLENFCMSVIEVMLFKLEDNGEIAAQNFSKYCPIHILSKQLHQSLGYLISNLQELKQQTLEFQIHPF